MTHVSYVRVAVGDERNEEFPALTRTMFVRYAGASGDFNPMHHDDTIAAQVGNPSVFGHGMLSMGLAARVVKDWFGAEAIRRAAGAVREAGVARRRAHVHRDGHRQARRERRDSSSTSTSRSRTRTATRRSPAPRPPRVVALTDGTPRRAGRDRHRLRTRHRARVRAVLRARRRERRRQRRRRLARRSGHRRRSRGAGVQGDRGARRRGGAQLRLRHRLRRRRPHRADRGRRVRHRRHPREQRGHRPRPLAAEDGRERLRRGDRRAPEGHVQLHAPRGADHEGTGLRPHRQHHVVGGSARQLRPDQLRRREGRDHGHDVRVVARARQVRHHRERGRAVGRDAHDRRRCSRSRARSRRPRRTPR